jgi:long-chain acyl-CoA synthetase
MKKTLSELFISSFEHIEDDRQLFFTKSGKGYIPFTKRELVMKAVSLINAFEKINIKKGDKIAIISENRIEWVVTDLACMFTGVISVPVYTSLSSEQIEYILENSEAKACFVSGEFLYEKVLSLKDKLPLLERIFIFNESEKYFTDYFRNLIESSGSENSDHFSKLKSLSVSVDEDDILTIIYTSGTTGTPKGVMLTHKNIYSNIIDCKKVLPMDEKDVFLSYLPYSHIYERTAGYYLALFSGSKIYYAQSIDTIAAQMGEVKPTFVMTVPRLLDKIYNRLHKMKDEMEEGFRKKVFNWGIKLAHSSPDKKSLKWKIADTFVYKKIRKRTGGNIRYFVSGGGALNKRTGLFFDAIGIITLEGYGMTETSPVISVNRPDDNKYGTVGKPLDSVNVKIAGDGEILVKGDLVMKGYYKDGKSTEEILKDGWLHTGDIGEFDKQGYLKITDRKKALFKTSGGKYVAPAQIEEKIMQLNYIDHVVAVGNNRIYVTALIVPNLDELKYLADKNNVEYNSASDLVYNKDINKIVEKDIHRLQKDFAGYEKVRRFTLLKDNFSIETGELTPTMKVKRRVIEEKYKDYIEKMY